jgi:transposase-like protein
MERSPPRIYKPEFRPEAVKLVQTTRTSVPRTANQLSIPKGNRDNWLRASRMGQLADVGKGQRLPTDPEFDSGEARSE